MEYLKISENILSLRRKRKVTQEELAEVCGVTKASVSKWENGSSYPDIMLLPKIAGFFDITIDELIGYEAQMSTQQIQKCYETWSRACAVEPFEVVYEQTKEVMRNYYACYPLLMEICVLWLNHFMLVKDEKKQKEILEEIKKLCQHIYDHAKDAWICSSAKKLESMVALICKEAKQVIETYEPVFEQGDFMFEPNMLLIQAYEMTGDMQKADAYNQISMYVHIVSLISYHTHDLFLHMKEKERSLKTIDMISNLSEIYDLKHLHTNLWLQFVYQSAISYAGFGMKEQAREALHQFMEESLLFVKRGFLLHGDAYFSNIDIWFEKMKVYMSAPRDSKTVLESLLPALKHPLLANVLNEEEFVRYERQINRMLEAKNESKELEAIHRKDNKNR